MTLRVRHAGLRTGQTGSCPVPAGTGGHGSIMEHAETVEGYEAVPLAWPAEAGLLGNGAAVVRRGSARARRRAGIYVPCPGGPGAPPALGGSYTQGGVPSYATQLRRGCRGER